MRLRRGIGPVRAIRTYSTDAPDGVRLLQLGKTREGGLLHVPAATAYWQVANRLHETTTFRDWVVIADVPAGPRQVGARFAAFARTFLVVVEPSWASALAARRVGRIARLHRGAEVCFVASKVRGAGDHKLVKRLVGEPVIASIPLDEEVVAAERRGVALLDAAPRSRAVRAIESLAQTLEARRLSPEVVRG
jgi:CO dehydrogenase maturation factor